MWLLWLLLLVSCGLAVFFGLKVRRLKKAEASLRLKVTQAEEQLADLYRSYNSIQDAMDRLKDDVYYWAATANDARKTLREQKTLVEPMAKPDSPTDDDFGENLRRRMAAMAEAEADTVDSLPLP